ncbi:MAG: hypothetical protein C0483_23530 [Pirellula sp.]|nr:hypothetical protein [Pirellula sp.]
MTPAVAHQEPESKEHAAASVPKKSKPAATTPPPRQDEPDLPLLKFETRFVTSPEEAESLMPAWKRLAETAIEANPFYEHWSLLPAWKTLAPELSPELLVIEAPKRVHPTGPKVLCGLFPIIRHKRFYGLPVRCWELWRHVHCFLSTPLVRRDCAREVIDCFFETAATAPHGAAVVSASMLPAEGPLHQLLVDANFAAGRNQFIRELSGRALFRKADDAETFLKASLSRSKRQGMQRSERRLAEKGKLETRWFTANDDLALWTQDFLKLEASGWKGGEHTALACSAAGAYFFRTMVKEGMAEGRVQLGRLDFDGRPIAIICNLLARDGGYSFKIAYDEAFADDSPGLLLELSLIRELHDRGISWMDSCAASDHPMINPLWPQRCLRQSVVFATGRRGGDLAVALMPLLRWVKNLRNRKPRVKPQAD